MSNSLIIEEGNHIVDYVTNKILGGIPIGDSYGIGTSFGGVIRGGVVFHLWNGTNVFIHCASDHPRWLNKKYLNRIFNFAFNELKVNRITGLVPSNNIKAINFNKHIGFEYECSLKKANDDHDIDIYVMWKDKCKWAFPTINL